MTASDDRTPLRILLAEDDFEMRRFLATALRKDGYEVIEAETGTDLLDALTGHLLKPVGPRPFDLIVSDMRMPGMSGLGILSRLRTQECVTPFILITAFGGYQVRSEALQRGAAAVFDKPFEIEDLRRAIVNLIGSPRPEGRANE
jgi:two-component system response regulator (stage 0 sporulation protein F)